MLILYPHNLIIWWIPLSLSLSLSPSPSPNILSLFLHLGQLLQMCLMLDLHFLQHLFNHTHKLTKLHMCIEVKVQSTEVIEYLGSVQRGVK